MVTVAQHAFNLFNYLILPEGIYTRISVDKKKNVYIYSTSHPNCSFQKINIHFMNVIQIV
jgi:hypothetical protein